MKPEATSEEQGSCENFTPEQLAALKADYDQWFSRRLVWRPITSAPKDGSPFLAWLGEADQYDADFYCVHGTRLAFGAWHWRELKFRPVMKGLGLPTVFVQPTHWMPLPQPPGEAQPVDTAKA